MALKILDELLYQKEPIQKIMITLYNHFKKIYIVKLSAKYGKDLAAMLNLTPKQSFLLGRYKSQAASFSEAEIRGMIDDLIRIDTDYKIGLIDVNVRTGINFV